MGERENFPNQLKYYNAIHNFLLDVNANNHLSMNNLYMSFFKYFNKL
jgi:hypothetical protein